MQEILTTFGIDWRLIVIQIFNFALLLALLWYFLYKPVLSMLDARKAKIEQGVRDAEAAGEKLAHAEEEKAAILKAAHGSAEEVLVRAKDAAVEKSAEVLADATQKGERMLTDAALKAREIEERARKESEDEIAKMAILAAEKILKKS
jgi:F-type H+-transporting ATPase subunit b